MHHIYAHSGLLGGALDHIGTTAFSGVASRRKGAEVRALTLRLDPEQFRQLALLAAPRTGRRRTSGDPVLRESKPVPKAAASCACWWRRMRLISTPARYCEGGEPDRRYTERRALFDDLLALPDAD